ncbi:hypothetical protein ABPG75_005545 [Micractinium tetrahymenae]
MCTNTAGSQSPRAAGAAAAVEPLRFDQRHLSDSAEEAGAQELPPEEEFFYDTQEYYDMESEYRKLFNVCDDLPDTEGGINTICDLVASLRAFANELEGLQEEGWQMDEEETLADGGCEFVVVNPQREREQWRLRRQQRRVALTAEQQRQQAAVGHSGAAMAGAVPTSMETDERHTQAAATVVAGAAVAGSVAAAASGLKSPQRGSAAFALF